MSALGPEVFFTTTIERRFVCHADQIFDWTDYLKTRKQWRHPDATLEHSSFLIFWHCPWCNGEAPEVDDPRGEIGDCAWYGTAPNAGARVVRDGMAFD